MFFHPAASSTFWATGSLMALVRFQHVYPDISRWFHLVVIMCCTFNCLSFAVLYTQSVNYGEAKQRELASIYA